jgi:serine/threonine-protein kinase HipA
MSGLLQKPVWVWPQGQANPVRAGIFSLDTPVGPIGRFQYDPAYLQRADACALDPLALPLPRMRQQATQYTTPLNGGLFGTFRDICPEGYGRDLLNHRYKRQDDHPLTAMELLEYSVGDSVGAIEIADDIQQKAEFHAPPAGHLLELLASLDPARSASHAVHQLLELGTSMGGERPKLTVQGEDALWLAKLQDRGDAPHVPAREYVAMCLARDCHIGAANVELKRMDNGREALLVRRFDRVGLSGERLPYLSAHTLLKLDVGSTPGDPTRSYLILADRARRLGVPPADVAELWQRMAFNSLVNNIDDHPRNHGFIRRDGQWRLAPSFDLVPMLGNHNVGGPVLAMAVTAYGQSHATVEALLGSASHFGLAPSAAGQWLVSSAEIVTHCWRTRMEKTGITGDFLDRQRNSFAHAESIAANPQSIHAYAEQLASRSKRARSAVGQRRERSNSEMLRRKP